MPMKKVLLLRAIEFTNSMLGMSDFRVDALVTLDLANEKRKHKLNTLDYPQ